MKRILQLLGINILVLLGLLIGVNYGCLVLMKLGFPKKNTQQRTVSSYHYIENDSSLAYNQQIWKELKMKRMNYSPYVIWQHPPFDGQTLTIDEHGNRIHKVKNKSLIQPDTNIRFFGGSAMWGFGSDDNGTIPAIYQNELQPEQQAFNHAEKGYVTRQNLAKLINLINTDAPIHDVVFFDGFNDILNHGKP